MQKEYVAFTDYVGLKAHFNTWDFVWSSDREYRRLANAWNARHDKMHFAKLYLSKPKREDRIEFLISAFTLNRRLWVGDMFDDEVEMAHRNRMSHRRAIMYNFRVDCDNIQDHLLHTGQRLPELLKIGNNQPLIFEDRVEGGVTDETLSILDYFFNFTRQGTTNLLWEETRLKLNKYKHVLALQSFTSDLKPHINTLLAINSAERTLAKQENQI